MLTHCCCLKDGSSSSKLVLRPEDLALEQIRPNDLLIECLASHPQLGQDFMTYAHQVEIMCKLLTSDQLVLTCNFTSFMILFPLKYSNVLLLLRAPCSTQLGFRYYQVCVTKIYTQP